MQNKPTMVALNTDARYHVLRGINLIYNAVRLTLGPQGGNAILYGTYGRKPRVLNDGKTIGGAIEPKHPIERMAADAFKDAADRTNAKAGDATTTTIVVGGKLSNDTFARIAASYSEIRSKSSGGKNGVMDIKREMAAALPPVLEAIKARAKKVANLEDLERIATISVEDPVLGKIIAKIAMEVGTDGFIDVVEGFKGEIETELFKGMRMPAKVGAKAFVNNLAKYEMVIEDSKCLVTNFAMESSAHINAFMENCPQTGKLVIFAPSFAEQTLVNLIAAFKQGLHIYPVACPALRTEQYQDLAVYLGAKFIDRNEKMTLEGIREVDFGFAQKVVVKDTDARDDAVIIGGDGTAEGKTKVNGKEMPVNSAVQERIAILRGQMEEQKIEMHRKVLERRIASMASAVGVIRVSAPSQAETTYQKLKIEDAVNACKSALEEGYVKGGGLCLKEIAEELPESILTPALKAPYEQIQANADGKLEIGDDVIDSAKAVRLAVEHSVSVVSNLITVKIAVAEEDEITAGEGYNQIAKAIARYVYIYGKERGIIKENEAEFEKDMGDRITEHAIKGDL